MATYTSDKKFLFFLGTEAELIKMATVIYTLKKRGVPYRIISSGQHDIRNSTIIKYLGINQIDHVLNTKPIDQTPGGLFFWFIITLIKSVQLLASVKASSNSSTWVIVHGDTVTTMMGAIAGKIAGLKVGHVEAGYKSGNYLHPFPEEIDRATASFFSDVLFCPYDSMGFTLKTTKNAVNTIYNTSIDTLNLALKFPNNSQLKKQIGEKKYFIFAFHRQDSLLDKNLVKDTIEHLINLKTDLLCVFTMHSPTKRVLMDLNLYNKIVSCKNIICITQRLSYFEYAHLLNNSEFIMSDGAGNQQETYYLGKPYLILRTHTDGHEGIGLNALLSKNENDSMQNFVYTYKKYRRSPIKPKLSPSRIICNYLLNST